MSIIHSIRKKWKNWPSEKENMSKVTHIVKDGAGNRHSIASTTSISLSGTKAAGTQGGRDEPSWRRRVTGHTAEEHEKEETAQPPPLARTCCHTVRQEAVRQNAWETGTVTVREDSHTKYKGFPDQRHLPSSSVKAIPKQANTKGKTSEGLFKKQKQLLNVRERLFQKVDLSKNHLNVLTIYISTHTTNPALSAGATKILNTFSSLQSPKGVLRALLINAFYYHWVKADIVAMEKEEAKRIRIKRIFASRKPWIRRVLSSWWIGVIY